MTIYKPKGVLTTHLMKALERLINARLKEMVMTDGMQFGLISGATESIFVVRQLEGKYQELNRKIYLIFVNLGKAYD